MFEPVKHDATAGTNTPRVQIYGRLGQANAYALRDFLQRSGVPFEWCELKSDEDARTRCGVQGLNDSRLPVCVFPDGSRLECPSARQVADRLGWFRMPSHSEYDVAIYGAGPAGLSAAVYGSSDGLTTVLVERWAVGGQAGSTSKIENYLGFPGGISGADFAQRAREQACKFGAEILLARAGVRGEFTPGRGVGHLEDGTKIVARASICATGVEYRRLALPNAERFVGAGIYYGAGGSEATLTRGQDVYIVGGGNSAGQAAMHFAPYARKVTLIVRDEALSKTLSRYLLERVLALPKIEVLTQTEVTAVDGDRILEEITLTQRVTGEQRKLKARWLFVCIGGEPNTEWAIEVGAERDSAGYLVTGPDLQQEGASPSNWPLERAPFFLETNVPGVFAAGDVRHGAVKRCASAAGEGAMAIAFVHRYLAQAQTSNRR